MPGFQRVTARISGFPGPDTSCAVQRAARIALQTKYAVLTIIYM